MLDWFRETMHDACLWPRNLVRDLPARSRRLAVTCGRGGWGAVCLPLEAVRAVRQKRLGEWARGNGRAFVHGLHLCLVQTFDLGGGPELAQFFFRLIAQTAPLTPAETAMISAILGPENLRCQDVRIAEGGGLKFIFKWNGNLAFTAWHTISLPQNPAHHSRANRALLVHELAHVYQYEKVGTCYMTEAIYALAKTKRDCYQYGGATGLARAYEQGKKYAQFNREQQAQIVQDYYIKQAAGQDVSAYLPYVAAWRDGRL